MGASITLAGEDLIARKQASQQSLVVSRFVFANVPGLDPTKPVDRAAAKPAAGQIVYVHPIGADEGGYVNPSQVVYSAQIGSDVGDWDFNWIGLETEEGVLFAVATVALQQKRRNIPPVQVGNNLTRNFLVVFDGAQALTSITVDASTWKHDFTLRLAGIDERERLSNRDVFGRACFFGSSLQLEKVDGGYQLKPGTAYIEGIRLARAEPFAVVPPEFPATAWLDVCLQRELNDVVASWSVVWGADEADYVDSLGVRHYREKIATLTSSTSITDARSVEPVTGPLVGMFAFRAGDYEYLRARATTKEDVGLGVLPNAKSDDPTVNDSEILATTAAVNAAMVQVVNPLAGMIAAFARSSAPYGWLKANGAAVSRTTFVDLFTAIGTTFGEGDGVNTFNLPDMRGEFIRGLDESRGVDPGRGLGSGQASQNLLHSHTAATSEDGDHTHTITGTASAAGAHSHTFNINRQGSSADHRVLDMPPGRTGSEGTAKVAVDSAGEHTHTITATAAASGTHSHTVTLSQDGGNEARPRNVAALYCIKY